MQIIYDIKENFVKTTYPTDSFTKSLALAIH